MQAVTKLIVIAIRQPAEKQSPDLKITSVIPPLPTGRQARNEVKFLYLFLFFLR